MFVVVLVVVLVLEAVASTPLPRRRDEHEHDNEGRRRVGHVRQLVQCAAQLIVQRETRKSACIPIPILLILNYKLSKIML